MLYVQMCTYIPWHMCGGQSLFGRIGCLLTPCGSQELISGLQALLQVSLPTEPSDHHLQSSLKAI